MYKLLKLNLIKQSKVVLNTHSNIKKFEKILESVAKIKKR